MRKLIVELTLALGMLCLPSLTYAGFLDGFKEQLTEKINETKEQVKQSIDNATNIDTEDANASEAPPAEPPKSRRVENYVTGTSPGENSINTSTESLNRAKALLSSTTARVPAGTGLASDVDVIGLRLGMTAQEAKTVLQKYDATLRLDEKYKQLPKLANSRYLHRVSATANNGEQIYMEFASPPLASTIIKVVRTTKYGEGAQPTLARTLQALKQKYGEPSMDKNNNAMMRQLIWLHDQKGNKMATPSAELERRCTASSIDNLMIHQQQDEAFAECGVALSILLATGINATAGRQGIQSNGLVGGLSADLTNVSELIRTNRETHKHINKTISIQAESVGAPRL